MTRLDPGVDGDIESDALPGRPGRRRDASRDPEILAAALDVLCESGYDGMTIDEVAARAKAGKATVYRRWASKNDLVVDAIACMKGSTEEQLAALPDTGTLRGDLLALSGKKKAIADGQRKMRMMAAVASMLSRNPDLADAVERVLVEPRTRLYRELIARAQARGEIAAGVDAETVAHIVPSMTTYRMLVQQKPLDRAYVESLVDGVVLPALGLRA